MTIGAQKASELLAQLPPVNRAEAASALEKELQGFDRKIIVLDDDPTGVQTVHCVSVYTDWTLETMLRGFQEEQPIFFILTNSRAFVAGETEAAHREIARHAEEASKALNKPYIIVSRGDSTLRGHYPLETETLRSTIEAMSGESFDGEVIVPFFKEGGRLTIDNVHYVQYGDELVPAGETEFAKDRTFGYTESDLRRWVEEKSGGVYQAADCLSISLERLRALDVDGITEQLLQVTGFNKVIVNAADDADVRVFAAALVRAIKQGKRFLFRSAASFTKIIGGVSDRPLLTREELLPDEGGNGAGSSCGGLILVGSHVKKTTEQLERLKACDFISFIEFDVHLVADPAAFEAETDRVIAETDRALGEGRTVAVYTRRERLDLGEGKREEELKQSVKISDAVTSIVQRLKTRPRYIVAKGGITSSDIGTKGLGVKRAVVAGQIKPGVPVWLTGEESRFPGIPYIIFPGNVGTQETLKETVELLEGQQGE